MTNGLFMSITTKRTLLGVLTPSSNTALEPLTSSMLNNLPSVTSHFSRFRVTRISLDDRDLGQFNHTAPLEASDLLADARMDVIGWSGTAAGWLGFDHDVQLCQAIEARTGIRATSSILALNEVLNSMGVKRFGLVSPYTSDVQDCIIRNYQDIGIDCVAESHLDLSENFSFSEVDEIALSRQVAAVAAKKPDAIVLYCTNLRSAHLASQWEQKFGIPVIDTTSTVVWKMLSMAGHNPAAVVGWGRFFQEASAHV